MRKIVIFILIGFPLHLTLAQVGHSLQFRGQASAWTNFNPGNDLPLWFGGRYLPELHYVLESSEKPVFDIELSAHLNGLAGMKFPDSLDAEGRLKPYRAWIRYTTSKMEIRLGMQKINFGSANMLRPLMWFDQVDPRDPLQLTDGVWGILGRYYFLNNANIWLWGLYGNKELKAWEFSTTSERTPEFGGRVQLPVPRGEMAMTYHHRKSDFDLQAAGADHFLKNIKNLQPTGDLLYNTWTYDCTFMPISSRDADKYQRLPENRIGIDAKWDLGPGIWTEGTWTGQRNLPGILQHQHLLNVGVDYTFALGNGLYMAFEQLLMAFGERIMQFDTSVYFSALSASYHLSLSDHITAIIYRDWTNKNQYHFLNYQRKYNKLSFYVMAFLNPDIVSLPQQSEAVKLFSGKGLQFMIVYNH